MAYNRDFDEYRMEAVVRHEPYSVEHKFLDDRLPAELQRSGLVQRWEKVKKLGSGAYGVVWLEKLQRGRETGPTVRAVKAIQKAQMRDERELIALRNFSTRRHLRSGYFVEFYGWFEDTNTMYMAMEYFPLGTLKGFIRVDQRLQEFEVRTITAQLLLGLADLHDQGYAHRDLKPDNIFVDRREPRWSVKIGDFGVSKQLNSTGTDFRTNTGTSHYRAPEVQGDVLSEEGDEDRYTNKADLWSLGCVVFEMAKCSIVFPEYPRHYKMYCWGKWSPTRPDSLSEMGWEFNKSLLAPDPRQRLSAAEALKHDWIHSGPSAGDRGTADLLSTAADTEDLETRTPTSSSSPDGSMGTDRQFTSEDLTLKGLEIGGYPKPTKSARSSNYSTSSPTSDRKPVRKPVPDEETGSQERGAKHDIYRTRELNWKHDGFPNSDKSWLALAKETFSIAEKIRKDLIRLETGQSQQEKHDVKDLNQKYAKHAKYASTLHSQHKYAELEHSNQSLLALSLGFYGRHPKPPFNLELGCLSMIAAAYEEQGKYPQASGIYEHIYQRQNEGKGIPESMHAELERRNRPSLKYWTRRANLLITIESVKNLPERDGPLPKDLIVQLELSHPTSIQSPAWQTKVTAYGPNPQWNETFNVNVDDETTLIFSMYGGCQGHAWRKWASVSVRVRDIVYWRFRGQGTQFWRGIDNRGGDFFFHFSALAEHVNENLTLTPTDNRRFKDGYLSFDTY